jgi:serine/threonine protein kinase
MTVPIPAASQSRSTEHRLADLIEELSARLEAGEPVELQACLDAHPEHADELRRLYPALQLLADFSRSGEANLPPDGREPAPALGTPLGDFRLVREIGRGGMGVVYEAEQLSLSRRVALKVLPFASTLDPRQLQRFKNEAQAAAQLHHTHIVPVHFVGCERGVHFYAMQFIDGQTLADLIRELRQLEGREPAGEAGPPAAAVPPADSSTSPYPLPPFAAPYRAGLGLAADPAADTAPEARLATAHSVRGAGYFRAVARLGIQAAEALEHAHQLGVVHRDVKPGNLLVQAASPVAPPGSEAGGEGLRLWVTDFGLAQMQSDTRLTLTGDLVGTLRYMSPEQALAQRVVVDHRTDIYSLGVTLYELLTLEPAFGGRDRQELLRQIAFDQPIPPRRLNRAVPKELDTIVGKAMEKNSADRYATAQEVADDLERFLEDKPIRARRPGLLARVQKWSWRHRGVVTAAVVSTILALAISSLFIIRQWTLAKAREEETLKSAALATAIKDFLIKDLIGAADPKEAQGRNVTVKQVLDKAARKLDEGAFSDQPEVEASVRMVIGQTYRSLAQYTDAEHHVQRALTIRQELLGPEHLDTLEALKEVGGLWICQGRYTEAEQLGRQTLATVRRVLGEQHRLALELEHDIALAVREQGRWSEAEVLFQRCLQMRTRVLGEEHPDTLETMSNLAFLLGERMGKWREAEPLARRCLEIRERLLGKNDPATIAAADDLHGILLTEGKWKESELVLRDTLARAVRILGPKHYRTLGIEHDLAIILYWLDQPDEAETRFRECLKLWSAVFGPEYPEALVSQVFLAYVLLARNKLDDAERMFGETLPMVRRVYGREHALVPITLAGSGLVLQEQGRWAAAEEALRHALADLRRALPGHFLTNRTASRLAILLDETGQPDEAGSLFRAAIDVWRKDFPPDHPELTFTLSDWAEHLLAEGDLRQAEPALTEALRIERAALPPEHRRIGQTLCTLGWLRAQTGQAQEGERLLREGLKICLRAWPGNHWVPAEAESRLGGCLSTLGQFADAEKLLLSSYQTLQGAQGTPPQRRAEATDRIVRLYEIWGKPDKAAAWRAKRPAQRKPTDKGAELGSKGK